MTSNPPPYAPEETKGLYPSVPEDPHQQMQMQPQQQPGVYYQPQGSPAAGAPGVASVTYYPQGPTQQQPQQLVISQPAPVVVATQQPTPSLICHIVLSCFVTWCCCCPCGFLAFILAVIGSCQGSPSSARQFGVASIVFSVIGIIITVVIVIAMLVFGAGGVYTYELYKATGFGCTNYLNGQCYMYKEYVGSEDECEDKAPFGTAVYAEMESSCYYNH